MIIFESEILIILFFYNMCIKYLWLVYISGNLGFVGELKYWGILYILVL